jgi:hypothetical protein
VNGLLNSKNAKDFELDACKLVQQFVKLDIVFSRLNAFINSDDQLISLINRQLSFCVYHSLCTCLDELLFKFDQVLEVAFLIDKVVLEACNAPFHVKHALLLAL